MRIGPVKSGRIDRIVYLPVLAALLVVWGTLLWFTMIEKTIIIERAQTQLGLTVSNLADFNELAQRATGDVALRGSESRSSAIWRALLQYPTASIWLDKEGVVTAGQPPAGDLARFVVMGDERPGFAVHAALPRRDALAEWRRSAWQRGGALLAVSVGFLVLARFLVRALELRARAEHEAAGALERVTQLALYKTQLERTVTERTGELQDANQHLEKELRERVAAETALRERVKELADANMIVQNSPTILYRLKGEPPFRLVYVSHNITKFGYDPKTLLGSRNWSHLLVDPTDEASFTAAMGRALEKDAQAASIEFRLRTGDGALRWVENRYTPVRDRDGRLIEIEGIIIDITERKAAEHKIAQLARTDGLTGLANRTTFVERLHQAFAAARRGASPFAILYIDLDHFKDVNDTLGHPVGDELLREVSKRLQSVTRASDVIARLGGDEFAILQIDTPEPANAGVLAAKLQSRLAGAYSINGNQIDSITASIGICHYSPGSAGPDAMLTQADLALYRSKDEGRNQYHFHTEDLDQQVLDRVTVANELRHALEHEELELFYQPQVEIASGMIVGMEALIRWHHPTRGLLRAAEFIPLAEKVGLTTTLGHWVLEQACRQMAHWRQSNLAPPVIAINLSLSQLKNSRELVHDVTRIAAKHGIAPRCLEFDVTESTLAQATLSHNDALARLRKWGAQIAIDDFGTEYSSFEYLRAYDVSHLKIAQSFINDSDRDPERAALVRAIIKFAHELNIGVIAEGVETESQRALLASTGTTTRAQGYFFSEAVPAGRADELLRQGNMKPMRPTDEAKLADTILTAGAK